MREYELWGHTFNCMGCTINLATVLANFNERHRKKYNQRKMLQNLEEYWELAKLHEIAGYFQHKT